MKTDETKALERLLMENTKKRRTFGVLEVTIGWNGDRRVDFMETNPRGIVWCYEIKVTKSDFHSPHGHNFVGHYNYYVLAPELFDKVKKEIPSEIGILIKDKGELVCIKKPKRRKIDNEEELHLFMVRSMAREAMKAFDSEDVATLTYWRSKCAYWKKKADSLNAEVNKLKKENRRRSSGK